MSATAHFLAKNFGLTTENIMTLAKSLFKMSGFIAGGAALYAHLGEDAPADQDLDIWIPTMTQKNPEYDECVKSGRYDAMRSVAISKADLACYAYDARIVEEMKELLVSFSYAVRCMGGTRYSTEGGFSGRHHSVYDIPYHTNPDFQKIVKAIHDFKHPESGRKIQVIYFYGNANPIENFDLDICKVQLLPVPIWHTSKYEFDSYSPTEINSSREMRITNMSYPPNLVRRIKKYCARGFTLLSYDDGHRMTDEEMDEFLSKLR
jgi:hypothetical protein